MKAKMTLLASFIFLFTLKSTAQELTSSNPYFVGHSLINFSTPWFVYNLALSGDKDIEYDLQIMNGASIQAQYVNSASAQGTPYTDALPTGDYDAFIITEAIPLVNHTTYSETYSYANDFLTYALNYRPDIRYFIYETWHCINTGTPEGCEWDTNDDLLWQPRLLDDFPKWVEIVDSVRTLQNYQDVYLIPAGQAFYKLSEEIDAGNVPGITSFEDFFTDDIHLTDAGNYFVACVMYACIFRASPEGLTYVIDDQWGNPMLALSEELATIMQEVAWETVCEVSYSGVDCQAVASSKINEISDSEVVVYPQPASQLFTLQFPDAQNRKFTLSNSIGKVVSSGVVTEIENIIPVHDLSNGIYILTTEQNNSMVSKKIIVNN